MKRCLLFLLFFPLVLMAQKNVPVKIKETNHGMYSGVEVGSYTNNGSPTGTGTEITNVLFFPVTDTIPLAKGNKFGIEFIVESSSLKQVEIEVVWTYPYPMTNDKGETFPQLHSKRKRWTNEKTFTGYHFDYTYEMLPGEWKLQLFYKGQLLHEHTFYIVGEAP